MRGEECGSLPSWLEPSTFGPNPSILSPNPSTLSSKRKGPRPSTPSPDPVVDNAFALLHNLARGQILVDIAHHRSQKKARLATEANTTGPEPVVVLRVAAALVLPSRESLLNL